MGDTLEIFGKEYTNVTGFKAKDGSGNTLTYTRGGGGGVDIPIFTLTWDSNFETILSVTCNKTYAQCKSIFESNETITVVAIALSDWGDALYQDSLALTGVMGGTDIRGDFLEYTCSVSGTPQYDIWFFEDGTITAVQPSNRVQTLNVTTNGTYTPEYGDYVWNEVVVNVPSGSLTLQSKTATPSETAQTITADSGYDGLSSVQINAMPSGTAGTPTATKGTVSNHSVTVTPSVTNSAGYIVSETKTGIGVTVAASELDNGTKSITSNGTSIDVVGYAAVDVAVPTGVDIPIFTVTWDSGWETIQLTTCNKTYSECCALFDNDGIGIAKVIETNGLESYVFAANVSLRDYQERFIQYTVSTFGGNTIDIKYDDLNETLVATYPSVYNLTLNVTENGTYIPESDEGVYTEVNVSVPTGTTRSASDVTVSGNTVTIPAGLYSSQVIKSVAGGSVTAPSSINGSSASVSTGTNTLTLTKTISVTPNVTTAGYISSGTAGNSSVSLTASINTRSSSDLTVNGDTVTAPAGYYATAATKAVAVGSVGTPTASKGTVSNHSITVTPSVTNTTGYITGGTKSGTGVTVSASELVSGSQTITENGNNIDVTNLASVNVALTFSTIYTGTSTPSSSMGSNGDIYIKTS